MPKSKSYKLILLVDDDNNIRQNYHDILAEEGYGVTSVCDIASAISSLKSQAIDLALLDISLYGDRMAGHHLCATIAERFPETRIVMLTSYDSAYNRDLAQANGAEDFWVKSSNTFDLKLKVKQLLKSG